MMHYYEDTLAAANEELAYYTDRMEHLNSVLDHYNSLVTLINGEHDYESIGSILEGKAHNLTNELNTLQSTYEMYLRQQQDIQAQYAAAVDENARKLLEGELKAINAQVDETYEALLSKTQEWAEA
jgi:hypothetical protein